MNNEKKYFISFSSFLILLVIIFSFLAGIFEICDYDFWYHLSSGKLILEDKGFPALDPFYYTLKNHKFITDYWLFQVILYSLYLIFAIKGIIIFQAVCLTITVIFLVKIGKLVTNSIYIMIPVLLAFIVEARGRFVPRPELFMMIFAAAYLFIINSFLKRRKNLLFLIPLFQIIWVNSHPSFVFGLLILLIYIIGLIINKLIYLKTNKILFDSNTKMLLIVLFLSLVSSFICPDPLEKLKMPFSFFFGLKKELLLQVIQELQGYKLRYDIFTFYSFILFFTGLTFILKIKEIILSDLFLFIFFAYLSLMAVRFVPIFMIIASSVLFENLEYIRKNYLNKISLSSKIKKSGRVFLLLLIFYTSYITLGIRVVPTSDYIFGFGISKTKFPFKLIEFIKLKDISGKMLNPLHYGGFLEWYLFPKQKVFIDGRMLGGTDFRNEYFMLHYHKRNWEAADKKYDFDYIIVEYPSKDPNDQLVSFLSHNQNYKMVYFDDKNILYLKEKPKFKKLIQAEAYNYISPFGSIMEKIAQNFYSEPDIKEKAKLELLRLLSFNNNISKAHHFLGNIYFIEKNYDKALEEYIKALSIDPLISSLRHNIALIYFKRSDFKKATEYFKSELKLFPDSIPTRLLLARSYIQIKDYKKAEKECYYILKKEPNNQKAIELLQEVRK